MTKQERTVIELIFMAHTKYLRDLSLVIVADIGSVKPSPDRYINAIWEEQKSTLAKYFALWDGPDA